jgi:uncharacterized protein related to proFAR isomerase
MIIMKKKTVVIGVILTLSVLTLVVIGASRQHSKRTPITTESIETRRDSQDARPLRDRAREARTIADLRYPTRGQASADLAELARRSTDVIIGTPVENVSKLSADGRTITLDYQVKVEYVYKGTVKQGKTITVSLPGGKLMFDDGSTAEVQTPWLRKMLNGQTYALFLNAHDAVGKFTTAGEAQGLFGIPTTKNSQAVSIHTGIKGDAMLKYNNMNVRAFLKEVRRSTEK